MSNQNLQRSNWLKKSVYVISAIIFGCSIYSCARASIALPHFTQDEFHQLKNIQHSTIKGDDCSVKYLMDAKNNKFILKQVNDKNLEEQILLVSEYVSALIAKETGQPILETYLIPREWQHPDKTFPDRVAILQTLAPGKQLNEDEIDLQQSSRGPENKAIMDARFGELKPERIGLRHAIVTTMTKNDDLCKIVALDTFINNSDRSPNLFYDSQTNHYYAIDHLAAFTNKKLAYHALRQIQQYNKQLTPTEKIALKKYNDVLKKLYTEFPPEKIISYMEQTLSTYFPEYKENADALDTLDARRAFIRKNYSDTRKLIDYLEIALLE